MFRIMGYVQKHGVVKITGYVQNHGVVTITVRVSCRPLNPNNNIGTEHVSCRSGARRARARPAPRPGLTLELEPL